jgi:hypothetical protein
VARGFLLRCINPGECFAGNDFKVPTKPLGLGRVSAAVYSPENDDDPGPLSTGSRWLRNGRSDESAFPSKADIRGRDSNVR